MKIKKRFLLILILLSTVTIINSCSSSSGTLRYGSQTDDKNLSKESSSRYYSADNLNIVEDTLTYSDEDVPEFQDPSNLPYDEANLSISEIMKKIEAKSSDSNIESSVSTKRDLVLMEIIKYLNTPYKYGGNSLNGIDCSAFTQSVFKNTNLCELNRSAREQFRQGIEINDRAELKFGDLVFFNTRRRVRPGHVGIYIGDNLFAHSSSKLGVTVSSLDYEYYSKRFMGARRVDSTNVLN
ncbi:MAG: C40 family peptidase [Ignavibacteriaceae bacterium]